MSERSANTITGLARLLVGIYIGALLAGPPPFGCALLALGLGAFHLPEAVVEAGFLVYFLVVPWAIAGAIVGRRLGPVAGLLGFLLFSWRVISEVSERNLPCVVLVTGVLLLVPAAFGWLGGRLVSHRRAGTALDGWRRWRVAAVVVLLLLTYTYTVAPSVARRTLHARFANNWPADSSKVRARAYGVYVGVDGLTGSKGDFPDVYYTDPTGLVFLYKYYD